jgi:hypothetical protein
LICNNNNNNDKHILTPSTRIFYQRIAIEGTQRIIEECWKIIKNPEEQDQGKIAALVAMQSNFNAIYFFKFRLYDYLVRIH